MKVKSSSPCFSNSCCFNCSMQSRWQMISKEVFKCTMPYAPPIHTARCGRGWVLLVGPKVTDFRQKDPPKTVQPPCLHSEIFSLQEEEQFIFLYSHLRKSDHQTRSSGIIIALIILTSQQLQLVSSGISQVTKEKQSSRHVTKLKFLLCQFLINPANTKLYDHSRCVPTLPTDH